MQAAQNQADRLFPHIEGRCLSEWPFSWTSYSRTGVNRSQV